MTDAPQVAVDRHSMFLNTPIYQVGSDIVFGLRRVVVPFSTDDVVVEVTQVTENRLDLIAYELYGAADLWWVIADFNPAVDPLIGVTSGVELRVPRRDRLFNVLSTLS